MQRFNGEDDLSEVESSVRLRHEHLLSDPLDQFTAGQELQDHVQVMLILQALKYVATEIHGFELFENVALVQYVLYVFRASNATLLEAFESKKLIVLYVSDKLYDAERALTKCANDLEVVNTE